MVLRNPDTLKNIIDDKEYQSLEDAAIEFITLTMNYHFQRIYSFILDKKRECYRPAVDVDKKELDKIHANHDLICDILEIIPAPIRDLESFISSNKNTLFDVGDVPVFYKWNAESGSVERVENKQRNDSSIASVTISNPQTGQSVTTTPEKIQQLAKKVLVGK